MNEQKDPFITLAEGFVLENPLYYDKTGAWWEWVEARHQWRPIDETDILNELRARINLHTFSTVKDRQNLLEAIRQVARVKQPEEPPKNWVQFDSQYYDLETGQLAEATDEWFNTNPIPWSLGETSDTPTIDRLFDEWAGPKWRHTLYEIIAYSAYRGYPLHTIVVLIGGGANGKSKFRDLLGRFIGEDNLISTELDKLSTNRFESAKLWRKLVAVMGETNFNLLARTAIIKELSGEDLIDFERKFKEPWSGYNYALLFISTNSLPITEDVTVGFFRRFLIIDFPNQFDDGPNPVDRVPTQEYRNLARKVTEILPELLNKGTFTNQGDFDERKRRYEEASNPFPPFLEEHYVRGPEEYESYGKVFTHYNKWLKEHNRRQLGHKEFNKVLQLENLEVKRTTLDDQNDRWILEVRRKSGVFDFGN